MRVEIDLLLLDVRLAILPVGKSAAADLAARIQCIPTGFDGAAVGFGFMNVT